MIRCPHCKGDLTALLAGCVYDDDSDGDLGCDIDAVSGEYRRLYGEFPPAGAMRELSVMSADDRECETEWLLKTGNLSRVYFRNGVIRSEQGRD